MKRIVAILFTLLMLFGGAAFAETTIGFFQRTDQEQQEDRRIEQAIEVVKAECIEQNRYLLQEDGTYATDGYLEILHTQVIYIRDEVQIEDERLQQTAESMFGEVECIVEFVIMTDFGYGFQPTTYSPVCFTWSVCFMKDGTTYSMFSGLFNRYRGITYSIDFTPIIASISDHNYEFNNTWYLLK